MKNFFEKLYIKKKSLFQRTNYFLFLNFVLVGLFQLMSAQKRINNNNLDIQNNISIKIKGNGYQYIFNSDKFPPDLVYLNGELTTLDAYNGINIETEEEENIVRLIWNNKVTSCENFFSLLTNIIEVDLSEFDFSEVHQ